MNSEVDFVSVRGITRRLRNEGEQGGGGRRAETPEENIYRIVHIFSIENRESILEGSCESHRRSSKNDYFLTPIIPIQTQEATLISRFCLHHVHKVGFSHPMPLYLSSSLFLA